MQDGRQKDAFLLIKSNVVSAYKTNSSKILCSVILTNAQNDQENENSGVPHFLELEFISLLGPFAAR